MGKKRIIKKSAQEPLTLREKEFKTPASGLVKQGIVFISASYNNTMMTLTDLAGNVVYWASAGNIGFSGTKKATPFAASKVAENVAQVIKKLGIQEVAVKIKGIGSGREAALRSLAARDVNIVSVKDVTPIPHNGTRPPKVRRV